MEKITDFIHKNTSSKIGIQLGHSGRKGAVKKPWEATNEPINQPWELISASPILFNEKMDIPKELRFVDINDVVNQFIKATQNAEQAGFDLIELQAHHGFLLASFLSPLAISEPMNLVEASKTDCVFHFVYLLKYEKFFLNTNPFQSVFQQLIGQKAVFRRKNALYSIRV